MSDKALLFTDRSCTHSFFHHLLVHPCCARQTTPEKICHAIFHCFTFAIPLISVQCALQCKSARKSRSVELSETSFGALPSAPPPPRKTISRLTLPVYLLPPPPPSPPPIIPPHETVFPPLVCYPDDWPSTIIPPPHLDRVYGFGDVHGELLGFQENLREAGLINDEGHWTGKDATVIQGGDVIDRGKFSIESYNYLEGLQKEAPQSGGMVVRLIGNHEMLLIQGNLTFSFFLPLMLSNRKQGWEEADQFACRIRSDILQRKIQMAYFDGRSLYVHGGLRTPVREILEREIRWHAQNPELVVDDQMIADHLNKLLIHAATLSPEKGLCSPEMGAQHHFKGHPIFNITRARGGDSYYGGVLWTDYPEIIGSPRASETSQIIAHVPPDLEEPPIRHQKRIWCIDAGLCSVYGGRQAFIESTRDSTIIHEKIDDVWKRTRVPHF